MPFSSYLTLNNIVTLKYGGKGRGVKGPTSRGRGPTSKGRGGEGNGHY